MTKYISFKLLIPLVTIWLMSMAATIIYSIPCSYVSLDINPSILYTVNSFGYVVSYETNGDAEKLITKSKSNYTNMKIQTAVEETIRDFMTEGLITKKVWNEVSISTANEDEAKGKDIAEDLIMVATNAIKDNDIISFEVESSYTKIDLVEQSKNLSVQYGVLITPGKLNLIAKLEKENKRAINDGKYKSKEDWLRNASVLDIMSAIHAANAKPRETSKIIDNAKQTTILKSSPAKKSIPAVKEEEHGDISNVDDETEIDTQLDTGLDDTSYGEIE